MKGEKLLIFDFDGTIVDTKTIYYDALNKHLNPLGYSKKEIDKAIDLGLSLKETFKKFLSIKTLFFWFILKKRIAREILERAKNARKCKNVDAIREIKSRKILISNSYSDFVFPILRHLKLKREFDEVYTASDFKNKTAFIKEYLKERKINRKEVFYVGDRVADVKLSRKVGIKSIIILGKCAWDSRREILSANPDYVIENLGDLKKII